MEVSHSSPGLSYTPGADEQYVGPVSYFNTLIRSFGLIMSAGFHQYYNLWCLLGDILEF